MLKKCIEIAYTFLQEVEPTETDDEGLNQNEQHQEENGDEKASEHEHHGEFESYCYFISRK